MLRRLVWLPVVVVVLILAMFAWDARRLPETSGWHEVMLTEEFSARDDIATLDQYLAIEEATFQQIDREIEADAESAVRRYNPDSQFNSGNHPVDWNRTNELVPETRRGVALLLHGVSDSPYSMRSTAEMLRDRGFHSLVLRIPGHGTTPGGLNQARWEDWRAAVHIGARHLDEIRNPDEPFVIVGYSNGGALAVDYSLDAVEDDALPRPHQLVLMSPAIGITRFAFFASWNRALTWIPYFERAAWQTVLPEYDPYK